MGLSRFLPGYMVDCAAVTEKKRPRDQGH